jgi:hypothetical protein
MFGRQQSPSGSRSRGTFGNFVVKNGIVAVVTFAVAFIVSTYLIQYFGWFLTPLAGVLGMIYPALNDAFFVAYITIYGLLTLFLMFFRYKTGSRI